MSTTIQVTCDGCGRDLTTTTNHVAYRLVLSPEFIPCRGGSFTTMHVNPQIDAARHFCGIECLKVWLEKPDGDREG